MLTQFSSAVATESNVVESKLQKLNEHAVKAWEQSKEHLLEILDLRDARAQLPPRAWIRRDRRDADDDINELLDKTLDTLRLSQLTDYRAEYACIEEQVDVLNREIVELREKRMTADGKRSIKAFLNRTRKSYTEAIKDTRKEIDQLEGEKKKLVEKLQKEYKSMGIELSTDQVRFYLSSVSGRDIMALSAVFDNVRVINRQLEDLMRQNRGDPEAARRYYGIHVVMLQAVVKAHETVLDNIQNRYLKRISRLAERNEKARKETNALLAASPQSQREILEASLRAQNTTDQVLEIYRSHLNSLQDRLEKALKAVRMRYKVASNAYRTISISSALANEMQTTLEDLAALQEMHLPELVPFDNEAIQKKFNEITAALQDN